MLSRYSLSISPVHSMTWSREQPSLVSLATRGPGSAVVSTRHRQSRQTRDLMMGDVNTAQDVRVNAFISREDLHLYPVFI